MADVNLPNRHRKQNKDPCEEKPVTKMKTIVYTFTSGARHFFVIVILVVTGFAAKY